MKITKREVIFSIALICIMLVIGIVLSDKINDSLMEQYQKYNLRLILCLILKSMAYMVL